MFAKSASMVQHRKFSVSDYYRMTDAGIFGEDDRVELIEGEIVALTPIGSPHASRVAMLLRSLSRNLGDRAILQVQNPVTLDDYSEPEPDLMLLRPRADYYASAHPGPADVLLLIEVAQSSLAYDRDEKLPLYAAHEIPEVWLVDVDGAALTVYRDPQDGGYRVQDSHPDLARMRAAALPEITFDLSGLF